jgi:hypothetical protein
MAPNLHRARLIEEGLLNLKTFDLSSTLLSLLVAASFAGYSLGSKRPPGVFAGICELPDRRDSNELRVENRKPGPPE